MTDRIRPFALVLAFVLVAGAIVMAWRTGAGVLPIILGVAGPDMSFLAAIGAPHERGRLPRRAVTPYNVAHHPVGPALVLVAAVGLQSAWLTVLGVAWMSHLAWDRGFGYGLRSRDGRITDGILLPGTPL
jgi:hypothetical protein